MAVCGDLEPKCGNQSILEGGREQLEVGLQGLQGEGGISAEGQPWHRMSDPKQKEKGEEWNYLERQLVPAC